MEGVKHKVKHTAFLPKPVDFFVEFGKCFCNISHIVFCLLALELFLQTLLIIKDL